jgi:RNA polymerase sporulation-specific sigma factor
MKRLPRRERIVLELRYGIPDDRAHHQHEIARHLSISRSYISRVEKHAIQMIRD